MFERPGSGNRALLVALDFGDGDQRAPGAIGCAGASAGATVVGVVTRRRQRPMQRSSPARQSRRDQCPPQRNFRDLCDLQPCIVGRAAAQPRTQLDARRRPVSLILDILRCGRAARRRCKSSLRSWKSLTRLVGGWSHLERQAGGIGLRGPGETARSGSTPARDR
jgi:GTP-binding protein HflX